MAVDLEGTMTFLQITTEWHQPQDQTSPRLLDYKQKKLYPSSYALGKTQSPVQES